MRDLAGCCLRIIAYTLIYALICTNLHLCIAQSRSVPPPPAPSLCTQPIFWTVWVFTAQQSVGKLSLAAPASAPQPLVGYKSRGWREAETFQSAPQLAWTRCVPHVSICLISNLFPLYELLHTSLGSPGRKEIPVLGQICKPKKFWGPSP